VSEIGLGGHFDGPNWRKKNSRDQGQRDAVLKECIKLGVNYLDTNADYERTALGISLAQAPEIREKVLVVADINDRDGSADDIYSFLLTSMDEQLRMLQVPLADVMRFTTVVRRTSSEKCEAAIRAFRLFKKQGKARFLAFSQHDPDLLLEWINRYDEIDIIYVPYNYFANRAEQELFPAAKKKEIGIVVIKPFNKGTIFDPRLEELIRGGGARSVLERSEQEKQSRSPEDLTRGTDLTLAQASLRFILSRPQVSTVIPGMETVEEVRENLKVAGSGAQSGTGENQLLERCAAHFERALPDGYRWLGNWRRT
jgi:aryl-alcohol dehydrogenase-like predicted oxidoreductase